MKKSAIPRTIIAAGLAIAGIGAVAPVAPSTAPSTVQAPQSQQREKAAPVTLTVQNFRAERLIDAVPLMVERRSAIWQGTAKRGNRRNRSRWSYNR